jgi:hypothetical protein
MTIRTFRGSGTSIVTVDEHGVEDSMRSSNPNVAAAKQRRMDAIFHDRRSDNSSTPKPEDTSDQVTGEPGLTSL